MTDSIWDPSNVREPSPDSIKDTLLGLQRGTWQTCLLRGLIQQLMETDPDIHSPTSGGVQEFLWKSKGFSCVSWRGQRYHNLGQWKHTETGLTTMQHVGAGPKSPIFMANVQLDLPIGLLVSVIGVILVCSLPLDPVLPTWTYWLGISWRRYA